MSVENTIHEILGEELAPLLYKAKIKIRSSSDRNITDIADELRGVCGITIVDTEPTKNLGKHTQITDCNIKFFLTSTSLDRHMKRMSHVARRIKGVMQFKPLNVEKVKKKQG